MLVTNKIVVYSVWMELPNLRLIDVPMLHSLLHVGQSSNVHWGVWEGSMDPGHAEYRQSGVNQCHKKEIPVIRRAFHQPVGRKLKLNYLQCINVFHAIDPKKLTLVSETYNRKVRMGRLEPLWVFPFFFYCSRCPHWQYSASLFVFLAIVTAKKKKHEERSKILQLSPKQENERTSFKGTLVLVTTVRGDLL